MLDSAQIHASNKTFVENHERDFDHLTEQLTRRGVDVAEIVRKIEEFEVAIPSWALGTGGTRFGRFPGGGEPRNVFEKMTDICVINQLTQSASAVSLHIPWDEPKDPIELREHASQLGLTFDAVNSNTFQDQPFDPSSGGTAPLSYKFGSMCHTDAAVRDQAIEHHLHVIDVGQSLGSDALSVWLADGSNYPGQMHLRKSFERTLDSLQKVYAKLPSDWRMFTEHKPYEPAFYATVVQDWGSSLLLAQNLGDRATCLVDLGHHLPNTNIELIVARLVSAGKLGGFHFNDSKYGDDDLTTGSIKPFQLFLVFNELVDYDSLPESVKPGDGKPAYMIDQSHNIKDPIEALIQSVEALQRAYAKALIIDRIKLAEFQESNDVLMAEMTLKQAYDADVEPLIAEARRRGDGAINPIACFRSSGYRARVTAERPAAAYAAPQSL